MNCENRRVKPGLKQIKIFIVSAVITVVIVSGCWNPFSPNTGEDPPPVQYHSPVDSAYKVLENLEYAYISRDIGHYLDCFRDDFEFHLQEIDWDDYNDDGILDTYWGLDQEEAFHINMFNSTNVISIDLGLEGNQQSQWTGDPTGQSYQLQRTFELKVFMSNDPGYRATGSALCICRPDTTTGEWYIWQWWDLSDT